jgi:uncharacterized damage-inducible protein DinB
MRLEIADVEELYRFNVWANGRALDAAERVDAPDFTRSLKSSHTSIRDTLAHIVWAEWIWLERWKGSSPRTMFSPAAFPSVGRLRDRFAEVAADRADWLRRLPADRLSQVVEYANLQGETWRYPLWQQLIHVVNHSTYHRGQVTTLLRQVGAAPAVTDFLVYYDEGGR